MFYLELDEKSQLSADFIAAVRSQLQAAFLDLKSKKNASLQSVGDKLGIDKSAVYRHLNGETNLSAKTISELSWALGKRPEFHLADLHTKNIETETRKSVIVFDLFNSGAGTTAHNAIRNIGDNNENQSANLDYLEVA